MNPRYRRQVALRSRRHRLGRWLSCGCHKRLYVITVAPQKHVATYHPPETWLTPRKKRIFSLPDLSTYQGG